MHGMTLEAITDRLGTGLERRGVLDGPLIDRTGLTGLFDLHLEFAVDGPGGTAAANDASENLPSIFSAVQEQLGLRIERTTGPREFLVIDHVERPSEN
jgi:uncharacterized protein (TIGR03435 family)